MNLHHYYLHSFIVLSFLAYNSMFTMDPNDNHFALALKDVGFYIFEHGTERSNTALRTTCKMLYQIGELYHDKQTTHFNATFKDINWVSLGDPSSVTLYDQNTSKKIAGVSIDSLSFYLPSLIIKPGGKKYFVFTRYNASHTYNASGNLHSFIANAKQIDMGITMIFTTTDPKRQYLIQLYKKTPRSYFFSINNWHRFLQICNGKKSTDIHHLNNSDLKAEYFKMNPMFELELPESKYLSKIEMLSTNYINTDKVSVFCDNKNYQLIVHEKQCTLSEKRIPYDALCDTLAKNEYEFDRTIATNETIKDNNFPYLHGNKQTVVTLYRLKKDSLLHDLQAQKYLYEIFKNSYSSSKLIKENSHKDLIGYYVTWKLFGPAVYDITEYDQAILKAIADKRQLSTSNRFTNILNIIGQWIPTGSSIPDYTKQVVIDWQALTQILQTKQSSFADYCQQVSKSIDE